MKNQILKILLIVTFLSCSAQTPVLPLYNNHDVGDMEGAYYKDLENFQDQFVGTWKYTNGTTSVEVTFIKKSMYFVSPLHGTSFYKDYLIGGVKYIENGVLKTNTLSSLLFNQSSIYNYYLYSTAQIKKNSFPICTACTANEKRLRLNYDDATTKNVENLDGDFVIRRIIENGIEKLKLQFVQISTSLGTTYDNQPTSIQNFQLPYGDYTLIKQP